MCAQNSNQGNPSSCMAHAFFFHLSCKAIWLRSEPTDVGCHVVTLTAELCTMNSAMLLAWWHAREILRGKVLRCLNFPEHDPSCDGNKSQRHILTAYTAYASPLPPSPLPVQYIHHSFINSENSSLVNCLGKFNFKRKLLKEKDIIKLQGSLCPLLVQGGQGDMCCALCSSALHCSVSGKSYAHV